MALSAVLNDGSREAIKPVPESLSDKSEIFLYAFLYFFSCAPLSTDILGRADVRHGEANEYHDHANNVLEFLKECHGTEKTMRPKRAGRAQNIIR